MSGPAERIRLLDLVASLNTILGTDLEPEFQPARAGDVRDSLASLDRIAGFSVIGPRSHFEEGLQADGRGECREAAVDGTVALQLPAARLTRRRPLDLQLGAWHFPKCARTAGDLRAQHSGEARAFSSCDDRWGEPFRSPGGRRLVVEDLPIRVSSNSKFSHAMNEPALELFRKACGLHAPLELDCENPVDRRSLPPCMRSTVRSY